MGSEAFWQRWWTLIRRQKALWWFAALSHLPLLGAVVLGIPWMHLQPPVGVTSPEAWLDWLQQHEEALLPWLVIMAVWGGGLSLAFLTLAFWRSAGIFALVRRVWGHEETPLPWAEARRGLARGFWRLMFVQGAFFLVGLLIALGIFGLVLVVGTHASTEEAVAAVMGGSCSWGSAWPSRWAWRCSRGCGGWRWRPWSNPPPGGIPGAPIGRPCAGAGWGCMAW